MKQRPAVPQTMRLFLAVLLAGFAALVTADERFWSDSKRFGNPKMDIVLAESERLPRASVLDIEIKSVGSSVGSSFFIVCSLRDLALQRGGYRYIVKNEQLPGRPHQMLVGFLAGANDSPEKIDRRFAGQTVIDLEQFATICDQMK